MIRQAIALISISLGIAIPSTIARSLPIPKQFSQNATLPETAIHLAQIEEFERALQQIQPIEERSRETTENPKDSAILEIAVGLAEMGEFERSLRWIQSLDSNAKQIDAFDRLAIELATAGYLDAGLQVADLLPESKTTSTQRDMAIELVDLGQVDRALQLRQKLTNPQQRDRVLRIVILYYLEDRGNVAKAEELLSQVQARSLQQRLQGVLVSTLAKQGKREEALNWVQLPPQSTNVSTFGQPVEMSKTQEDLLSYIAYGSIRGGEISEALTDIETYFSRNWTVSRELIGEILASDRALMLNQLDRIQTIVDRWQTPHVSMDAIANTSADLVDEYREHGDSEVAEKQVEKLLLRLQGSEISLSTRIKVIKAIANAGYIDAAWQLLEKIPSQETWYAEGVNAIAVQWAKQGDLEKARSLLRQIPPNNNKSRLKIWQHFSWDLADAGELDSAIAIARNNIIEARTQAETFLVLARKHPEQAQSLLESARSLLNRMFSEDKGIMSRQLAIQFAKIGEFPTAKTILERRIFDRESAELQSALSRIVPIVAEQGNYSLARDFIRRCPDSICTATLFAKLSRHANENQNPDIASESIETAIANLEGDANTASSSQ
jgi:thioredoxin-like negative regulator of GroEL